MAVDSPKLALPYTAPLAVYTQARTHPRTCTWTHTHTLRVVDTFCDYCIFCVLLVHLVCKINNYNKCVCMCIQMHALVCTWMKVKCFDNGDQATGSQQTTFSATNRYWLRLSRQLWTKVRVNRVSECKFFGWWAAIRSNIRCGWSFVHLNLCWTFHPCMCLC